MHTNCSLCEKIGILFSKNQKLGQLITFGQVGGGGG